MIFSIKKITVHEENAAREPRKFSIDEKLLSGKVSFKCDAYILDYFFL